MRAQPSFLSLAFAFACAALVGACSHGGERAQAKEPLYIPPPFVDQSHARAQSTPPSPLSRGETVRLGETDTPSTLAPSGGGQGASPNATAGNGGNVATPNTATPSAATPSGGTGYGNAAPSTPPTAIGGGPQSDEFGTTAPAGGTGPINPSPTPDGFGVTAPAGGTGPINPQPINPHPQTNPLVPR